MPARPAHLARLVALLCAAVLAAALLVAGGPAAPASASATQLYGFVNAERQEAGLPLLARNAALDKVAQDWTRSMASSGTLAHNPRLASQVPSGWRYLGENVGYAGTPTQLHRAWMSSAGHRANILDAGVTQMGIGVAWSGTRLWVTQVFRMPTGAATTAAPAPSAPAPAPTAAFVPPAACSGASGSSFADVPRSAWYVGAVDCAVSKALANGVTSTTYAPAKAVTRAQMASFVNRLLQRSDKAGPAAVTDLFADDAGSPHETAINTLASLGVINGTSPGVFSPQASVTRAQMASMLVRLQESLNGTMAANGTPFADIAGNPHAVNIDKVFTAGITSGTSASTFSPNASVRRDGMTVFLVRTFGGLADAGAVR